MNKATITFDGEKALELTGTFKSYAAIDYRTLRSKFELGDILAREPEGIIVKDIPLTQLDSPYIMGLISNSAIMIEQKYQDPREVPAPKKWIFIVTLNTRRFEVI